MGDDLAIIQGLFDVVLCMGVFYHHRSPVDLLKTVRQVARPGVSLWLDTIIIPGDDDVMLFPKDRYAKCAMCILFRPYLHLNIH